MPRPRKPRILARQIDSLLFKPAGIPADQLRHIILEPEELEALRLVDLQGLSQVEAAAVMGISRSTFQRILYRARRQVALALCDGMALAIMDGKQKSAY